MDFFENQDEARKRTGLLVVCYAAAVLLTIVAVYAVLAALLSGEDPIQWWQADLFAGVAVLLGLLIVGGSVFKISALSAGGSKVAAMLGAREIDPDTSDPDERRLLNIVEEMSIASGISPPPVFVIDAEDGINAFAAGFRPADAVIGVTRGCLRKLSRDELQGVIAHEFSHILNGDMRLNIKLIGVLHGLLMIHLLGLIMLRVMVFSGAGRSRRRSSSGRTDGRVAILIFVLGLAMMIIGAIGVLFGRLIKSAVSRQREYLADAAAVQFTRNPSGLAGALKKIGDVSGGGRVRDPHAEELSHLFFANGLSSAWLGLMATHPPIQERIRRLDPAFETGQTAGAKSPAATPPAATAARSRSEETVAAMAAAAPGHQDAGPDLRGASAAPAAPVVAMRPDQLSGSIGALESDQLNAAQGMLAAFPAEIRNRLHQPEQAAAAVLALLTSGRSDVADRQHRIIAGAGADWVERVHAMRKALKDLDSSMRLAVIDLALPALQRLKPEEYRRFRKMCVDCVAADGQISVFEYALMGIIERHLAAKFEKAKPPAVRYHALKPLLKDAVIMLGVLARFGNQNDSEEAGRVFAAGVKSLDPSLKVNLPSAAECGLEAFDRALKLFRQANPLLQKRVLHAGAVCVAANGRVTVDEGNLLRAVADAFDAPMPPVVATSSA